MHNVDFVKIINRFKNIFHMKYDKELHVLFDVTSSVFSSWKKRNTIPIDKIVAICVKNSINLHWVLTGEGVPEIRPDFETQSVSEPRAQYFAGFDRRFINAVKTLKGDMVSQGQVVRVINHELSRGELPPAPEQKSYQHEAAKAHDP